MYGKSNMETCIPICKRDSQREFAVWLRKLKQGLCIHLERWDGAGDGREVQKRGVIGDNARPFLAISWSSASSFAIPPPVPPSVNAGLTITG